MTDKIRQAAEKYLAVHEDFDSFDGDRRGIGAALYEAKRQLFKAVIEDVVNTAFPEDET